MNIEVYDDFLPKEIFNSISTVMLSDNFPWFISKGVNNDEDGLRQMIHIFYRANLPNSNYFDLVQPFFNRLSAGSLIRSKANLVPKTEKIIEHGFHNDQDFHCKVAILYVNTNDGYTIFESGKKINSVANRLVVFDNDMKHSGTSCTNAHERVVINVNFTERVYL